jgi:hypothetical protein
MKIKGKVETRRNKNAELLYFKRSKQNTALCNALHASLTASPSLNVPL